MDELDPRRLQELADSLSELTGSVNSASEHIKSMASSYQDGTNKVKKVFKRAVEVQQKAVDKEGKQLQEEESLENKQKKLFEDELRYRGYKIDATGKEVKTRVELTVAQRQELNQLDKRIAKEKEVAEALADPVKSFRDVSGRVNSLQGVTDQLQEKLFELTGNSKALAAGLLVGTSVISGVFKAATSMADSLYKGERGAKVGAKALREFTDEITKVSYGIGAALLLLPGLGIIARIAGLAITGLSAAAQLNAKLNEMGAEYNDKVYDAFNKLSEVGLTTADGMSGVSNTIEKLSVTSAELDKFNTLVTSNAKDLALFGGTASLGLEKFADVTKSIVNPLGDVNKKLLLLGITSDQQREHTLKYMAMQTRMGLTQNKTQADLTKGSVAYMEELDRIATLTGVSRKEQEDNMKAVLQIEQLRAAAYQAERRGDTKRQRELEAATIHAKRLLDAGRKKEGAAFAQLAAADFAPTSQDTASAMQSQAGAIQAIKEGKSGEDVYQAGLESTREQLNRVAANRAIGGDVSAFQLDFNAAIDDLKGNNKLLEEMKKKGFTSREEYAKYLQSLKKDKPDPNLLKNVEAIQIQQRAGLVLDQAAKNMNGAALAMANSIKAFNEAVELFAKARGVSKTEAPKDIATAVAADKKALENQQKAMDEVQRVLLDPKATEQEKQLAKVNAELANREAQIALAQRKEKELQLRKEYQKDMAKLRKEGKADQVIGLDAYIRQKIEEANKDGRQGATSDPRVKAMQQSMQQAVEPATANNPATPAPSTSDAVPEQPNPSSGQSTQPAGNTSSSPPTAPQSSVDSEIPIDVPKALLGGMFKGPDVSSVMPNKSTMTANEILSSIKNSMGKVERKTVENELPNLENIANKSLVGKTTKSAKSNSFEILDKFTNVMERKLDDVIGAISENNTIKEEILLYSRV